MVKKPCRRLSERSVSGGSTPGARRLCQAPASRAIVTISRRQGRKPPRRADPVILDGEVVGAGIPDTVTLYDIPDHPDYKYVVVNNQPVLESPADRKILHVYS